MNTNTTTISNPLQHPSDHLTAIGSAVAVWSFLELQIDSIIWKLLGLKPSTGIAVTSNMSFSNKKHTFLSLVNLCAANKTVGEEIINELQNGISLADNLYQDRNSIMHGIWYTDQKSITQLIKLKARGRVDYKELFTNIDEINNFINDAYEAGTLLKSTKGKL